MKFRHNRSAFWVFCFLCYLGLFYLNVTYNEVTKFTDALYYADPNWLPGFLPQGPDPGRRQWLFQLLVTPLLVHGNFLVCSLLGRLLCFGLFAVAFARIAIALGLKTHWLLLTIVAFYYFPSLVAGEWVLKAFEAKVIAYGLVFLALGRILKPAARLPVVAVYLGLATSFHVLIGLYASFAVLGVLLCQRQLCTNQWKNILQSLCLFCISAAFAIRPIATQLLGASQARSDGSFSDSFIYSHVRAAHHLNPAYWESGWIWKFALYVGMLAVTYLLLGRLFQQQGNEKRFAIFSLLLFCCFSMISFCIGLLLAPGDLEGRYLQYYLFRFGDTVLPFTVYMLTALTLQEYRNRVVQALGIGALAIFIVAKSPSFVQQVVLLNDFPGEGQLLEPDWQAVCDWARLQSARDALFIVPPGSSRSITFPWLARRRVFATWKQTNLSGGRVEWYRRLSDLVKTKELWPKRGLSAAPWLQKRYEALDTRHVRWVMEKYRASYFVTRSKHSLALPVVFSNKKYTVYAAQKL